MDLRQLRYFVAVARERNFTRAAAQLHIAQPPLSRQIQLLEEELGVQLVIRDSRPVQLTDAGRLLHEQAIQILGRVEQTREATRRVGLHQRAVLSIGFVASTLYGGLPAVLKMLRARAPELEIRMVELMSIEQLDALKAGRIDLGFGRVRHSDPGVAGIVVHEERLAVALPKSSPLAGTAQPLPIGLLAGQPLIVYPKEPRPGFADQVLDALHGHGVEPAEVHEVREIQTALGLAAAGFGVCLIPVSACQMRHDLDYRLIDSERVSSPVILNYRLNDRSPYIALVEALIEEVYR